MTLCKHQPHKVIDDIKDPKYSTNEILIATHKVLPHIEHYIIRFSSPGAEKDYGWFYMSGQMIRRHKTQRNGRGEVYVVPLSKREEFEPMNRCEHSD